MACQDPGRNRHREHHGPDQLSEIFEALDTWCVGSELVASPSDVVIDDPADALFGLFDSAFSCDAQQSLDGLTPCDVIPLVLGSLEHPDDSVDGGGLVMCDVDQSVDHGVSKGWRPS